MNGTSPTPAQAREPAGRPSGPGRRRAGQDELPLGLPPRHRRPRRPARFPVAAFVPVGCGCGGRAETDPAACAAQFEPPYVQCTCGCGDEAAGCPCDTFSCPHALENGRVA